MSPRSPGSAAHLDHHGPRSRPPVQRIRRRSGRLPAALAVPAALALLTTSLVAGAAPAAGAAVSASAAAGPVHRVTTVELALPAGMDPSEPHLAVDPGDPARLFAVVQATSPDNPFGQELLWRTADRGRTWLRSPVLGGVDNSAQGASGDPVVAAAGRGRVLFGTLTFDFASVPDTAVQDVGTRVSTDGGASFTRFGIADEGRIPLCFFAGSCPDLPPGEIVFVDKPWLTVDTTSGRFDGRAYLVWVRIHFDTTSFTERHELLVATSRDGGRTYGRPVALDGSSGADLAGLEELAQLAVRPDGTVDAVWNGLRAGLPVILHASSGNGGRSFSVPEVVTRLRPDASRLGIVTSLAASSRGRLGLCWSQAVSADRYDARVACTVTDGRGRWQPGREILPRNRDRQYLPAVAFQRERLWAAAYLSGATSTRLVVVPVDGDQIGDPVTVDGWPVPSSRICAPHPPDCLEGQTFIGDYIGLVATAHAVVVAYIAPSAGPGETNRVLVGSLT